MLVLESILDRIYRINRICRKEDCGAAAVAVLLRASRLRRDASAFVLCGSGVMR